MSENQCTCGQCQVRKMLGDIVPPPTVNEYRLIVVGADSGTPIPTTSDFDEALKLLKNAEFLWDAELGADVCPWCESVERRQPHKKNCELGKFLKKWSNK